MVIHQAIRVDQEIVFIFGRFQNIKIGPKIQITIENI